MSTTTTIATNTTNIATLPVEIKLLIMKYMTDNDLNLLAGAMSEIFLELMIEHFPKKLNTRQVIVNCIQSRNNKFKLTAADSRLIETLPQCKYLKHIFRIKHYDLGIFLKPQSVDHMQLCRFERDLLEVLHSKQSLDDIWNLIKDIKLLTNTECFLNNKLLFNFAVSSVLDDLDVYVDEMISSASLLADHHLLPNSTVTPTIVEILSDVTIDIHLPLHTILNASTEPTKMILKSFCDSVNEYIGFLTDCKVTENILTVLVFMLIFGWQNNTFVTYNPCNCCKSANMYINNLLLRKYQLHDVKQMYMTAVYKYILDACNFERGYFSSTSDLVYLK